MNESLQISSLLGNDVDDKFNRYANYENLYITDSNNSQYNGQLIFDTMLHQSYWLDYNAATLEVPLSINLPKKFGNAHDEYPLPDQVKLAFKNNVANLVTGIQLKINNVDIMNSQQINILNNISTFFDSSNDWSDSSGQVNCFFKDTSNINNSYADAVFDAALNAASAVDNAGAAVAVNAIKTKSLGYNEGFAKRIEWLKPYYVFDGNFVKSINLTVSIPLKELSTFFESLSYPLYNCRLQLYLTLSNTASSSNACGIQNCFMIDTFYSDDDENNPYENMEWIMRGTAPSTAALQENGYIVIGNSVQNGQRTGCHLVVPKITYGPETATKVGGALLDGKFVKKNNWIDSKVYYHKKENLGALENVTPITTMITPGIRKPSRVYCVIFDATPGKLGWGICSEASPAPCATASCGIRAVNLEINNQRIYNPDLYSDLDMYNLMLKETPSSANDYTTGSLISFNDFVTVNSPNVNLDKRLGNHKYHCFNLSKLYASGQLTEAPCSIRFVGEIHNNGAVDAKYDVFFIIETEASTEINFSNTMVVSLGQAV